MKSRRQLLTCVTLWNVALLVVTPCNNLLGSDLRDKGKTWGGNVNLNIMISS